MKKEDKKIWKEVISKDKRWSLYNDTYILLANFPPTKDGRIGRIIDTRSKSATKNSRDLYLNNKEDRKIYTRIQKEGKLHFNSRKKIKRKRNKIRYKIKRRL